MNWKAYRKHITKYNRIDIVRLSLEAVFPWDAGVVFFKHAVLPVEGTAPILHENTS